MVAVESAAVQHDGCRSQSGKQEMAHSDGHGTFHYAELENEEIKKAQMNLRLLGTEHPAATVTVASFRIWRGWRRDRRSVRFGS